MSDITKRPATGLPTWQKKLEQASGGKALSAQPRRAASQGPVVILSIDCSRSMEGDKLRQARRGAMEFGEDAIRRGYMVGVVMFASTSSTTVLLSPTASLEPFRAALEKLAIAGSTDMASGIDLAVGQIDNRPGSVICIVTDGEPNSQKDTITSANKARVLGIEIMAVGTDDADWKFLSQIVTRTELAAKVERSQFRAQIASMAKKLPELPTSSRARPQLLGK
jgi:Mg-chelatase subunit ChlD